MPSSTEKQPYVQRCMGRKQHPLDGRTPLGVKTIENTPPLSFGHRYPSFGDMYLPLGQRYLSFRFRCLSSGLRTEGLQLFRMVSDHSPTVLKPPDFCPRPLLRVGPVNAGTGVGATRAEGRICRHWGKHSTLMQDYNPQQQQVTRKTWHWTTVMYGTPPSFLDPPGMH